MPMMAAFQAARCWFAYLISGYRRLLRRASRSRLMLPIQRRFYGAEFYDGIRGRAHVPEMA